jgi:hypothetical protein
MNDTIGEVKKEVIDSAISSAKEDINSLFHSHPNDSLAAFSPEDI